MAEDFAKTYRETRQSVLDAMKLAAEAGDSAKVKELSEAYANISGGSPPPPRPGSLEV